MRYRYRSDEELKDSGVEWIGKIPKDWSISRIDKEFKVRNEKVSDKEYPPLSVTKQGILPQLENVAKSDNSDNRKKVCVGDFVINSRADRKGSCGVSSYDGSVSLICNVLTSRKLHPRYVHSLFRNYYFSEEFYRWGSGIVDDLWSTNIEKMKKINIPIPSKNEDVKIANFLDEKTSQFDSIISKKEKLIERLEEAKKSLISEVVTGKVKVVKTDDGYELVKRCSEEMKDSGVKYIGSIYKNLNIMKFRRCVTLKQGLQIAQENRFYEDGENRYKYITIKYLNSKKEDIDTEFIENPSEGVICNKQDVLLARTGATGKVVTDVEGVYHNNFFKIIYDKSKLTRDYLVFYLKQELIQKQLQLVAGTTTIPDLNHGAFLDTKIIVPLIEEQNNICNFLEVNIRYIDKLIDKTKLQINKLKEAKQSLISESVTGKIEILD